MEMVYCQECSFSSEVSENMATCPKCDSTLTYESKPRLFWVVRPQYNEESPKESEIFDTKEEAENFVETKNIKNYKINIEQVKNYYKDGNNWNYEDRADTLKPIITIIHAFNN